MTNPQYTGPGWAYFEVEQTIGILLEIAELATTPEGEPQSAGAMIKMSPIAKMPPIEKLDDMVKAICQEGLPQMEVAPSRLKPISWQKFIEEGYET